MKFILLLINLLAFSALYSQPLSTLLNLADAENLSLKALDQAYQADLEKVPQVGQLPNPELGLGAFILPVETRRGTQRARLSATQMFPWFGTLQAKQDLVLTQAQTARKRIESQRLAIHLQVKQAYYQLYELDQSRTIISRNMAILESLKSLTTAKVESGKATLADILRVDLKIQELQQELNILDARMQKPLAELNQLFNRGVTTPVMIQDSLGFASLPYEKDTLLTHIQSYHPMINLYALQQEVSRNAIAVNQREGKPSFGIGMDYILVDKLIDAFPANNGLDALQLRASVSIPIYRKKYAAKDREETLRIEALESQKQATANQFIALVEQAYADHETAALRQELYRQQINTIQAAIQILEIDYSTNNRNFDELLRLQSDLIEYDLKMLRAIVQSQLAKAKIDALL